MRVTLTVHDLVAGRSHDVAISDGDGCDADPLERTPPGIEPDEDENDTERVQDEDATELGSFIADPHGNASIAYGAPEASLEVGDDDSVVGRTLVVYAPSRETGTGRRAGAPVACGVILPGDGS